MTEIKKTNFLEKMTNYISEKLGPLGAKIQKNKVIQAITDATTATMPILIAGNLCTLITSIDLGGWQSLIAKMPALVSVCNIITAVTSNAIAIYICIFMAYSYGKKLNFKQSATCIPVALATFLMLSPLNGGNIDAAAIGTKGLLNAMICGAAVPALIKFLIDKKVRIHMPSGVPKFVEDCFTVLIPACIIFVVAGTINYAFAQTTYASFTNFIFVILQKPISKIGLSLPGYCVLSIFTTMLWWCGIHGSTVFGIITPFLLAASAENLAAFQAKAEITNIIDYQFYMLSQPGNRGCMFIACLVIAIFCRSKRLKEINKVAAVPAIFGIGEPTLFGIPCLLNPIMFLPLVLMSAINACYLYGLISVGLVGMNTGAVLPWTTPVIVNAFLSSTTPLACGIAYIIMLALDVVIWLPFMKAYDNQLLAEEKVQPVEE